MGTTGASMLLIRPLIRANDNRKPQGPCGGVLHLHRLERRRLPDAAGRSAAVPRLPQGRGFFLDRAPYLSGNAVPRRAPCWRFSMRSTWFYRSGRASCRWTRRPTPGASASTARANFWLLGGVVALVLLSGFWKSTVVFNVAGTEVGLPGLVRDVGLIAITLLSLKITPRQVHADNQFSWGPMAGSGQAVRRHFPDHHSGDRDAQGRTTGRSAPSSRP